MPDTASNQSQRPISLLIAALGLGWLLSRRFARPPKGSRTVRSWFVTLMGVYLAECVAFSASMATNVLGYGLAVVCGVGFGRCFARHGPSAVRSVT